MLCVFAIIVLPAISRKVFLIILSVSILASFYHEFGHRQFLAVYTDLQSRYFNVVTNMFISMFSIGLLIFLVVRQHRKEKEEKELLLVKVEKSLEEIKRLKDFLPICANCKKIRDDEGYWRDVTTYISEHTDTVFSHGICQECAKQLYPEFTGKTKHEQ